MFRGKFYDFHATLPIRFNLRAGAAYPPKSGLDRSGMGIEGMWDLTAGCVPSLAAVAMMWSINVDDLT